VYGKEQVGLWRRSYASRPPPSDNSYIGYEGRWCCNLRGVKTYGDTVLADATCEAATEFRRLC
jgi:bisphosphoglycerate-dependent phosphoglycerate mutase